MTKFKLWIFCLLAVGLVLSEPSYVLSAPQATVPVYSRTLTYQVYLGGINAVTAQLHISYPTKNRYIIQLSAQTKGLVDKIVPWRGTYSVHGQRLKVGYAVPESYTSHILSKGQQETTIYNFDQSGAFKSFKILENDKDVTPKTTDKALTQGTIDALTAALRIIETTPIQHKCEGHSDVFDGARRYTLTFNPEEDEKLDASAYNIYQGQAARCTIEIKPVAGKWYKKPRGWLKLQEQARHHGHLPTLWVAQLDQQGPAIPVQMQAQTDYGLIVVNLTKIDSQ